MATPEMIPVESSRFQSWYYDAPKCELWVKYPPSKKHPSGSIIIYGRIAPETFEDGEEASSKGSWLYHAIIEKPERHPFRYFEAVDSDPKPSDNLVPEPIRALAELPELPLVVMPEILAPEVAEGQKPFNQVVKERASAIAASVPHSLLVSSADAYKALGSALVVIRTERIAVNKALDTIARPMVDLKRIYDAWRNEVLAKYDEAEKRLEAALQAFRRAEDARIREEEIRQRRENEVRARRQAEEAAETRRQEQAKESRELEEAAQQRLREAQTALTAAQEAPSMETSTDSLFGAGGASVAASIVAEATMDIARANSDLADAARIAAAPVEVGPIYIPPAVVAKPDLKVTGLRRKPPLWRWRIPGRHFHNPDVAALTPIRRTALRNPGEIPDEYWVLDEKAISGHVSNMGGVISIPQVEAYDINA
jgi:hypothetical protein